MRKKLKALNHQRLRFRALVANFGVKTFGPHETPTILLTDVRLAEGEAITDHLWFTKGVWAADLNIGDQIEFDARADSYQKGYRGGRAERLGEAWSATDYKLNRPTKLVKIREVA